MTIDNTLALEAMLDLRHPLKTDAATWAAGILDDGVDGFDRARWKRAADHGIQALTVPATHGGLAVSGVEAMLAFEGLGLGCSDNGTVFALASQVFPTQMALARFGTDEQQRRWFPGLLDGSVVGAFAMSEPDAGSDTAAIETTATVLDDGRYRLDGTKAWISLASVCDLLIVFATTDRSLGRWGLTAFLVDAHADGVRLGAAEPKLGMHSCPFGMINLNDCIVDADAVLGSPGAGAAVFSAAVEAERAFLYAAQVGSMERVIDRTVERARSREQFGHPIGAFQGVSHRIADMKLRHESARLLLYKVAALHDRHEPITMAAALAKLSSSESAVTTALDAVRLHGAEGYTDECGIGVELCDAIGGYSYSGTSEIQRNIVASLLGVDRSVRSNPSSPKGDRP